MAFIPSEIIRKPKIFWWFKGGYKKLLIRFRLIVQVKFGDDDNSGLRGR